MTPKPNSRAACATRIRFVFDDSVVSFRLSRTPTFSDIASTMGELATRFGAAPRAIDVVVLSPSPAVSAAPDIHDAR